MKKSLFLLIAVITTALASAEEITVAYSYDGGHNTDFSGHRYGLAVGEFSDARSAANPELITDSDLGSGLASDGYMAEKPLTDLIREAFVQGFQHGNANMDVDNAMTVQGVLNAVDAEIRERDGTASIRLTLRVNVQLSNGSRTIWQTNLFGRGEVPVAEGMGAAVHASLNRLVRELVRDDYFLLELQ